MDLFLRVSNGIEGTPMPKAPGNLTSDDVWSIIAYVRSLPREAISRPEIYDVEVEKASL